MSDTDPKAGVRFQPLLEADPDGKVLRQINNEWEERVRRRTAELEEANKELNAFAQSVSHDLRAPLRAIQGFGGYLTRECAESLGERGRGYLQNIVGAADRMSVLIDDLLQFARASRSELRRAPVDLSALAGKVAGELSEAYPLRPVEFSCAPGLVAQGDERWLRVALVDLLGNSWKYTGKVAAPRVEFGVMADDFRKAGDDTHEHQRTISLMVAGCAALAALLFVTTITRSITRPLRQQAGALSRANDGLRTQVAERSRAEQSLRESEARVRAVVDTALDAVVTMDADGRIVRWNTQAEGIFGWKREEAVGRSFSEIIVPPQHRETHECGLKRFLASGHGPVLNKRIEITAMQRDGREIDVELAITPLKMEGRIEFSAFLRDISERKRTEAQLTKAHQELLDVTRRAGMADVATSVLHNVGNVLNSVNVSASLIADRIRKSKSPSLARVCGLLRQHAADLGPYLMTDPKGKQVPGFLDTLAEHLVADQAALQQEMASMTRNIEHIKDIVSMQQAAA